MSNMNWNGGRGGIQGNKAVSVSEHKFGGSHKGNPGGKRGDSPVSGSLGKKAPTGGGMNGYGGKKGAC